jgi:XTP/dITP diphosphohydrolase
LTLIAFDSFIYYVAVNVVTNYNSKKWLYLGKKAVIILYMKLFIATNNIGKQHEIISHLQAVKNLTFMVPSDIKNVPPAPAETGKTYRENAFIKANFYHQITGLPTLADDSGLTVTALPGELGISSRRWGGSETVSDEDWLKKFLTIMSEKEDKSAAFMATLCYINADEKAYYFEGTIAGVITQTAESDYPPGLPAGSCFKPTGATKVLEAMTTEEKMKWNHRGKALEQFREWLEKVAGVKDVAGV